MDIYTALKTDHKKVAGLLDQLVAASESKSPNWKSLVEQIRDELIPHSRAEEALFYNPIRESEFGKGVVGHAYAEHAMAETELRTLQAMEKLDIASVNLAKKLRADLLHHVEEEESKVFAAGKKVFNNAEAQQIAAAFEQLKPFVKGQTFVGTSMDLVSNLLPAKMRAGFVKTFMHNESSKEGSKSSNSA